MRSVSVVVPVKNSGRTIGRLVASVLAQDYEGDVELLLVGDPGDRTWDAIGDDIYERRVRVIEVDVRTGGRDANAKRNAGLRAARGDIIALTDSDMVLPPDWVSAGVALLERHPVVAGPMVSAHRDFWGSYVDQNPLASKTPRMERPYLCDATSLSSGISEKLPITANVLLRREVIDAVGGLDAGMVHSYEDYEFFQRIVDHGYAILCTPRLAAVHAHRQGWRALVREYHRSGRGCADFVRRHPESALGRSRLLQLAWVCSIAFMLTFDVTGTVVSRGHGPGPVLTVAVALLVLAAAAVGLASAARTGRPAAIAFPVVTLVLGLSFSAGLVRGLTPSQPPRRTTT